MPSKKSAEETARSLFGFLIDPEDGGDMLLCNVRLSPTTWHYKPEGCTLLNHCCATLKSTRRIVFFSQQSITK
jgi:hypothetical protein